MTINQIKEDLKNIKYYYGRKKVFDNAFSSTGENDIIATLKKYNSVVVSAPPKLYDIYVSLYVNNHTQESLSNELGYTPEYIFRRNKELVKFLNKKFNEGENKNEE